MNVYKQGKTLIITYVILWFLSFVYYNVIISYSVTPAVVSSGESRSISNKVSGAIDNIFKIKHKKKSKKKLRDNFVHHLIRKIAHMANFFIFSFINIMLFFLASKHSFFKTLIVAVIIGFFGGCIDEATQLFIEGRSGMFGDVIFDVVGSVCACFVFSILMRKRIVFRNKKVIV